MASGKSASVVDQGLSAAEKAELEQLRTLRVEWEAEREAHKRQKHEEGVEKLRLIQEINELQTKNSQLGDEHTTNILAIKSRDTQLTRMRSDLDLARERIAHLESEIEKASKNNIQSPSKNAFSSVLPTVSGAVTMPLLTASPSSLRTNMTRPHESSGKPADRSTVRARRESLMGPIGTNRLKTASYSANSGGSNFLSSIGSAGGVRTSAASETGQSTLSGLRKETSARSTNDSESNWKRAAEVTLQLKARIESMRQRHEQSRNADYAK